MFSILEIFFWLTWNIANPAGVSKRINMMILNPNKIIWGFENEVVANTYIIQNKKMNSEFLGGNKSH